MWILDWISAWLNEHLGGVFTALLLLILAFIVGAVVKRLVVKLLSKTRLREFEGRANPNRQNGKTAKKGDIVSYIGKLVYLLVFLLFVPGIFSALNIGAVSEPISNLLGTVWGYLPNIIAAVIVLVAGTLIAKLIRELLIPVFRKIRLDKLQQKAGIEVKDDARLSTTLAYIVYVIIIIPVIITALYTLRISVITDPAVEMLRNVLIYVPNIVVAIVLIVLGTRIGKFIGQIVRQLIASGGVDEKIGELIGEKVPEFSFSKTSGIIVQVILDAVFIIEGIQVLRLAVLTSIGSALIAYLPNIIAAALIIIAALLLSGIARKALEKGKYKKYVFIARAGIFVIAAFMVLDQLGIAGTIVNWAFMIILTALGIAFALSFGLGSRGFASRVTEKLADRMIEDKNSNHGNGEK